MSESWRELANKAIGEVLSECRAEGMDLLRLTPAEKGVIKKHIDEAYPFGQRNNFPYKAWLDARKVVFLSLNIPAKPSKKTEGTTGQTSLFN